eukprot:TRINITY_DN14545_c0_g2_i1.p1 TRINITY_DN14545_c0_g2~~TRINITY_DN14545_c0_g2_i1.p1  ORF type:complete len:327 (-),score=51.19 TRINITY_DN14545_c0_g2_i1:174-1109(-)
MSFASEPVHCNDQQHQQEQEQGRLRSKKQQQQQQQARNVSRSRSPARGSTPECTESRIANAAQAEAPSSESCFVVNARWWRTPGALKENNALSDYDRDQILEENPLFSAAQLVELNQYVITYNSQDSHLYAPQPQCAEWYENLVLRRSMYGKELRKHQRRQSKIAILQRSYIDMVCESESQALKIVEAVKGFCYYILTRRDGSQEYSSIFDELCTDAIPLTATLFPRNGAKPTMYFELTSMWKGDGEDDVGDIESRCLEANYRYPDNFCLIVVCTKDGGPLPEGYECPPSMRSADESVTRRLYDAILASLR